MIFPSSKTNIFIFCFCLFYSFCQSQSLFQIETLLSKGQINEARKQLAHVNVSGHDEQIYFDLLKSKCYYLESQFDSSEALLTKHLLHESELTDSLKAKLYLQLGAVHLVKTNYPLSIQYYTKAQKIYEETNNYKGLMSVYYQIGQYYFYQHKIDSSGIYCLKSLKIAEEKRDTSYLLKPKMLLATLKALSQDRDYAFSLLNECLVLAKNFSNDKIQSDLYDVLAKINSEDGNFALGMYYFKKNLVLQKKMQNSRDLANSYYTIAAIYLNMSKIDSALIYLDSSETTYSSINYPMGLCLVYNARASIYYQEDNFSSALPLLKKAYEYAVQSNFTNMLIHFSKNITHCYEKLGNYPEALAFMKMHIHLKDSLESKEVQNRLNDAFTKYESEKKQLELNISNNENRILKQKITIVLLAIILLIIAFYFFAKKIKSRLKREQKENKKISEELINKEKNISALAFEINKNTTLLNTISEGFEEIKKEPEETERGIKIDHLYSSVRQIVLIEKEKDHLEEIIHEINERFYQNLYKSYPNLSDSDKKIIPLLKLNLSSKEIASILNLNLNTVDIYRSRLRKKFNLQPHEHLNIYLSQFDSD